MTGGEKTHNKEEMVGRTPANGLAAFTDKQTKINKNAVTTCRGVYAYVCGRKPPPDPLPRKTLQAVMVAP